MSGGGSLGLLRILRQPVLALGLPLAAGIVVLPGLPFPRHLRAADGTQRAASLRTERGAGSHA